MFLSCIRHEDLAAILVCLDLQSVDSSEVQGPYGEGGHGRVGPQGPEEGHCAAEHGAALSSQLASLTHPNLMHSHTLSSSLPSSYFMSHHIAHYQMVHYDMLLQHDTVLQHKCYITSMGILMPHHIFLPECTRGGCQLSLALFCMRVRPDEVERQLTWVSGQ